MDQCNVGPGLRMYYYWSRRNKEISVIQGRNGEVAVGYNFLEFGSAKVDLKNINYCCLVGNIIIQNFPFSLIKKEFGKDSIINNLNACVLNKTMLKGIKSPNILGKVCKS